LKGETPVLFVAQRLLAAAALLAAVTSGAAAEPLKIVASFSILADLVAEVGGGHVEIVTLIGPDGDTHAYEPSPADARAVAGADLVVVNGLGFEGWLERLVEASGYRGAVAVASRGVDPIEIGEEEAADPPAAHAHEGEEREAGDHHGALDPHAWQSAANAEIYVRNIAEALCAVDGGSCGDFRANASAYAGEIQALDRSIKAGFARIPVERRKVITTHDAFGYFGRAYGIAFLAAQGVSTESEASAADVGKLIEQIRAAGVTALFVENVSDPRLIKQIGRETGVTPGGELYSDALSAPDGPARTYIEMMQHNADTLQAAMQGS
jgi:zinc/manganese transport system substrate-binding protein